jgi:hypothetical protein
MDVWHGAAYARRRISPYRRAIESGRRGAGRPTVAGHTATAVRLAPRQHI